MLILKPEDGQAIADDFAVDFVNLLREAWDDFIDCPFSWQLQSPSVRASIVWNQVISRGLTHFQEHPRVRVEKLGTCMGFVIDDRVFVRPKYAKEHWLSRNYPTRTAMAFHDQTKDLFNGVSRLELLYALDDLERTIDQIVLVQRHHKRVLWGIDLIGDQNAGQALLNFTPAAPSGTPASRIIKPKEHGEGHATNRRKGSTGAGN